MPDETAAPAGSKPGWKTSEFWLAIVTANLLVFNQKLGFNLPIEGITAIAGVVISYVLGRSVVKK